jgi:hypothetical protein
VVPEVCIIFSPEITRISESFDASVLDRSPTLIDGITTIDMIASTA